MNEVENVFAKVLLRRGRLTAVEAPEVYDEKRQIVRKSGLLEYIEPEETIDGVGGLNHLKEWLRKRRRAFHPAARRFAWRWGPQQRRSTLRVNCSGWCRPLWV